MSVSLHTNLGDIKIEICCDTAPRTAENFLALCASGAYDGTKFHRNIKGFMVQGGDPLGTGKGGESIWGGAFEDEFHPQNRHNCRGIVSMANSGPNTNKQQFFITYAKQPHLNNVYTVFGKVIDGMDTLDAMEKTLVDAKNRPLKEIVIKSFYLFRTKRVMNSVISSGFFVFISAINLSCITQVTQPYDPPR
ncbi:peptidyl-prolyl cis-trans isomerase-like 3 [Plasmopara halstedii]|uniref:Peptidyl-prolyl cis-trans isomerase n=1 Tax=Plasmopara halstedii TaxID=4781 RepID=A0A0P1B7M7_PLAHL|nr:peptidyl-prolyl cis-trans isomerase-like 3 [Plasmopara halstedii]CEG50375.1 peptidyl-prolyl cis-trans isomerase-like 3 [Plasmopara halstedii]|eukprot:XP_024586744.1 peptidyl-prolyl cis-trans isomerase-like 3 [Plasmopara halstedii]